jgi:hypothetical protein
MSKFLSWFERNRKSIGYVIGGVNLGSGVGHIINGDIANGVVYVILGLVLVLDTRMFK